MEGSVNSSLISPFPLPSPQRVMSPSRLAKLPPIADESNTEHLNTAKSELKSSMHHLLDEAQSAETRMQSAVDNLWQRMIGIMESKENDLKRQLSKEREELALAKAQLQKLTEREAALTSQNVKMSVDLVSIEKREQSLQEELSQVKIQLKCKETEFVSVCDDHKSEHDKLTAEFDTLKKTSAEQTKVIKEYQDKVSKMTDKLQRLSKDLTTEKESSHLLQKNSSNQMSQKTSENRKMALEISKLKAQLATSTSTLSATREEVKKLELQLKHTVADSEAIAAMLNKKHSAIVKSLEEKIHQLEEELAKQQAIHEREIYMLNEKLQDALHASIIGEDDYMMARIKFLQHQNQQEKAKLQQQKASDNNK